MRGRGTGGTSTLHSTCGDARPHNTMPPCGEFPGARATHIHATPTQRKGSGLPDESRGPGRAAVARRSATT
eukprot:8762167-Pyramimonas_sp.AAC.1